MKRSLALLLGLCFFLAPSSESVTRYKPNDSAGHGVTLSLSDPSGSVYQPGEEVRFSVQTDRDAYVVVFDIDSEGFVHLLYPRDAGSLRKLPSGEHAVIPRAGESLIVAGKKGMEFVFAVSVAERDAVSEREISFLEDAEKLPEARRFRIDGDPFLAANRIARQIVRGVRYNDEVSMAYTYFYIKQAVDYPRYLCESCDKSGKDPYGAGASTFAATLAFDREDRLSYPLPAAFEAVEETAGRTFGDDAADDDTPGDGSAYADSRNDDDETNVYVNYYPVWTPGYSSSFLYDPFYFDPYWGYYPFGSSYYGSSLYFSVGFNWGGFGYAPYYYSYYPYDGFYGFYDFGHNHHRTVSSRSLRHRSRTRYKGALRTAMTSDRPHVRHKSRSIHTLKSTSSRGSHAVHRATAKTRPVHKLAVRPQTRHKTALRSGEGRRVMKPHRKTRTMGKPVLHQPRLRGKPTGRSSRYGKVKRHQSSKHRSVTHHSSRHPSKSHGHSVRSRSSSHSHARAARSSGSHNTKRGKGRK